MGKILSVDLSSGGTRTETPDLDLYRDFIGGYGVGARLLYSRQKPGADPLGPDNILGVMTGPLTGTPAVFGCRFAVFGKSPLTGGWGDANCGGFFGPFLKFSGYDGVLFHGVADSPVYLLIDGGRAGLKDAAFLWGKGTYETEDALEAAYPGARVACIGPAGEKLALISCIITDKGSAAGRSGLGAVMGSKKLKAIVVRGNQKVTLADPEAANDLRKSHINEIRPHIKEELHVFGTMNHSAQSAHSGDSPVKNWGGVGVELMPDVSGLAKEPLRDKVKGRTGCWRCPIACRGKLGDGPRIYPYPAGTRRPEYETTAAFGAMCLNTEMDAIIMANHICNSYGLDTISTGTVIAFAMECYEHGLITRRDTDGLELKWGNPAALVAMTEKMARREGFGDILADGVRVAVARIGKGADKFAVHCGGQEPGLHDPKCDFPAFIDKPAAARFKVDATPGRHTSGFGPSQFQDYVVNAAGLCLHSDLLAEDALKYLVAYLKAVTGWDRSLEDILKAGERIENIRHVFCLREGDNPLKRHIHPRIIGRPPFKTGPLAGVTSDIEAQIEGNLKALDWDDKGRPNRKKLLELGLDDVAQDLWG
jgi:aldehyde:ferredoxin oxidoreductase